MPGADPFGPRSSRRWGAAGMYRRLLCSPCPVPRSQHSILARLHIPRRARHQPLRDTCAAYQARAGTDEERLLLLLGLADDPRNRASVARYVTLGAAPL